MKPLTNIFMPIVCAGCAVSVYAFSGHAWAEDGALTAEDWAAKPVNEASISLDDCRRMVPHVADDDVAYRPGEDVYGNPVVPAEGPDAHQNGQVLGEIRPPDEIVIDFGLDLAGLYGIPAAGLYTATGGILTITYDLAQGSLMVNGKPLRAAESQAVAKACKMMLINARTAQ